MPKLQIRDIVNPQKKIVEQAYPLPGNTSFFDLSPEDIPADAKYICAVDEDGNCLGAASSDRLRTVLQAIVKIPLESLLDELADAVVAVDIDGVIIYVNSAYTQILGVPAGKILGKNMHVVENGASLLKVLCTGQPIAHEKLMVQTV